MDSEKEHDSTTRKAHFKDTLPGEHPSGVQLFREGQTVPSGQLQNSILEKKVCGCF